MFAPVEIRNDLPKYFRNHGRRDKTRIEDIRTVVSDLLSVGLFATTMALTTAVAAASGNMSVLE
jgi:hypothetical protein